MPSNEKRFGFSLLSKSNNKIAYPEEVMVDKLTGDFAIKTPLGDTISYNYNTKLNEHMKSARQDANSLSIYGNIYNIPFSNRVMPLSMTKDSANLYESVYIRGNIKRFVLHADIDSIKINVDEFSMDRYYGIATFGIKIHYDDNSISEVLLKNINTIDMNDTIFDLSTTDDYTNLDTSKGILGIEITQFDITGNTDAKKNPMNAIEVRHILNSLFIIVEER